MPCLTTNHLLVWIFPGTRSELKGQLSIQRCSKCFTIVTTLAALLAVGSGTRFTILSWGRQPSAGTSWVLQRLSQDSGANRNSRTHRGASAHGIWQIDSKRLSTCKLKSDRFSCSFINRPRARVQRRRPGRRTPGAGAVAAGARARGRRGPGPGLGGPGRGGEKYYDTPSRYV